MLDSSESRSKELNVLLVSDGLKKKKRKVHIITSFLFQVGAKAFQRAEILTF